jgi:hypothetical protein
LITVVKNFEKTSTKQEITPTALPVTQNFILRRKGSLLTIIALTFENLPQALVICLDSQPFVFLSRFCLFIVGE